MVQWLNMHDPRLFSNEGSNSITNHMCTKKRIARKTSICWVKISVWKMQFHLTVEIDVYRGIDIDTSSCMTNCFGVGADTIIPRAVGEMKPSSTALSMKDSNEL